MSTTSISAKDSSLSSDGSTDGSDTVPATSATPATAMMNPMLQSFRQFARALSSDYNSYLQFDRDACLNEEKDQKKHTLAFDALVTESPELGVLASQR